jgi:Fic family protein
MRREDLIELLRHRLVRLPKPHEAHYGVIPITPDRVLSVVGLENHHANALKAFGRAEQLLSRRVDTFSATRMLVRREAVASSSIEGTNSTLDELLLQEAGGEAERTETKIVRDYALTISNLMPIASAKKFDVFDIDFIAKAHHALMIRDPDYRDPPGELRTTTVWIGGGDIAYSTYNPPPSENVAALLNDYCNWVKDDEARQRSSPISRLAAGHAYFEAIHPFRDGNGRVGRLLMTLAMAAEDLPAIYLSPYIEKEKNAYYEGLKAAQKQLDISKLTKFFCDAVIATVNELEQTLRTVDEIAEGWKKRIKAREDSHVYPAINLLRDMPVLNAGTLAERLKISSQAANTVLRALVDNDIVRERTGYKRNRIFAADQILSVFNRPFGEEPILEATESGMAP